MANGSPAQEGGSNGSVIEAPKVVLALSGLLVAIYLVFAFSPPRLAAELEFWLTLWPRRSFLGGDAPGGWLGAIAPFFTSVFVHTDFIHLLANTGFLLAFGKPVAHRIGVEIPGAAQGAAIARFLVFFVVSGLVGSVVYAVFHPTEVAFVRGASGAISGLLGALIRFALRSREETVNDPFGLSGVLENRVLYMASLIITLNAAISLFPLFGYAVAGEAHIGGFLFGLFAFPLFALRQRDLERRG